VITLSGNKRDSVSEIDGVRVHEFKTLGNRLSYLQTNAFLYKFLDEHVDGADIIHQFHLLRMGLPTVMFGRRQKKPVITSLMGADTYDPWRKVPKLIYPFLSFIMNNSACVTSPSEALASYAYEQGYNGKIIVIPHGVDIDKYAGIAAQKCSAYRARYAATPDTKILFSIQRLHHRKRIECLILAIRELVNTHRTKDFKLLVAGEGDEREKLERLVDNLGLRDFIDFLGFVSDDELAIYYNMADIFVFHSTFEAFGLVLAEAMAAGKPVVSTRVGAIPEVVEHNETGLLIPPEKPLDLAKAIKQMLEDSRLAESCGAKGRSKAMSLYGWDNICDQYIELYKRVTNGKQVNL
jgi:glycosyltransferase involved in cell wall biosynthesis